MKEYRINEDIRATKVRLVDQGGEQIVCSIQEALEKARQRKLDLVEIAPQANPPVCKIIDYGKFRFDSQKKEKESKKKQKVIRLKEIRMQPVISSHDLEFKVRNMRAFLESGNHVKVIVRFRGRQLAHLDIGRALLGKVTQMISDVARVDSGPNMEGRMMSVIYSLKSSK